MQEAGLHSQHNSQKACTNNARRNNVPVYSRCLPFYSVHLVIVEKETRSQDLSPLAKFLRYYSRAVDYTHISVAALLKDDTEEYVHWRCLTNEIKIINVVIISNITLILSWWGEHGIQRFVMWVKQGHAEMKLNIWGHLLFSYETLWSVTCDLCV